MCFFYYSRRPKALRLWHLAPRRRGGRGARDPRHARLRGARGAAVRTVVAGHRHLVDRRAGLRPVDGMQSVRRRHQTGDVPQHIPMQPALSRGPVRGRVRGGDGLYSQRTSHQTQVSALLVGVSFVASTNNIFVWLSRERMTATECLNHQWLRCSPDTRAKISEQNSPQLILSPAEQTPEIRLQIATSQPSINHTLAATPSSKSNSFYDDTDDTLYDTRNPTMPPHATCTPTNTTPVAAAPPSPPSNDLQKSLKDAALSPLIYFKDTASHCTNNKENLSCNVKFFGINFKTTASEMTTTVPTMATGPMHAVTPLPAKPGHMPPTSSHHHFPDAPTTPKVSRKSSPDSPPSVKALVKKFQLAAPDSQTTSSAADPSSPNCAAIITQHHSRRTEFNASSYAPTNFDLTSDSAHPGDIAAAAQTAQHLCRPLNVSTASSSSTTTVVISASSSPSAGMPSSLCKPMSVEQGIIC